MTEHTPAVRGQQQPAQRASEQPAGRPWRSPPGWVEEETRVKAERASSAPLNYSSLADLTPDQIDQIERTARVDIRRFMDRQGLTLDETTLRVHWQLTVDGYGFRMPEGYIHPEAPPEEKAKARENWLRAVNGAADSIHKAIYCTVWRKVQQRTQDARALSEKVAAQFNSDSLRERFLLMKPDPKALSPQTDEVIDAELVEEDED